jgi:hypothetical protein
VLLARQQHVQPELIHVVVGVDVLVQELLPNRCAGAAPVYTGPGSFVCRGAQCFVECGWGQGKVGGDKSEGEHAGDVDTSVLMLLRSLRSLRSLRAGGRAASDDTKYVAALGCNTAPCNFFLLLPREALVSCSVL